MIANKVPEVKDVRPLLLDEYLELKRQLDPLEKRCEQVKKLLKDLIVKDGAYTDEERGVVVFLQDRSRTEYNIDGLRQHFPNVARGVIVETVDTDRMKQALALGEITESELDMHGVRIRSTYSRALMVEALKVAAV